MTVQRVHFAEIHQGWLWVLQDALIGWKFYSIKFFDYGFGHSLVFERLYAAANVTQTSVYPFCKLVLVCRVIQTLVRHDCEGTIKVNRFGLVHVEGALNLLEVLSMLYEDVSLTIRPGM